MVGFNVIKDIADRPSRIVPCSSATYVAGDLIELAAGSVSWTKVTSASTHFTRKAIVMSPGTTVTSVLAMELSGNELVRAESANNSNVLHNGDRMAFTDENTVNNSGTDVTGEAAGFVQTGTTGATTDKQIIGYVLVGSGVDPDAA